MGRPIAPSQGGGAVSLEDLFANGEVGFIIRADDLSATYQSSTGGALADDAGEVVGFAADDKDFGGATFAAVLASQPEMVINGTFATGDLTGWASAWNVATVTYDSGRMKIVGGGGSAGRYQDVPGDSGFYVIDADIEAGAASNQAVTMDIWTPSGTFTSAAAAASASIGTTEARRLIAMGAGVRIRCHAGYSGAGGIAYYDNISVKAVPGNHARNSNSGERPTRNVLSSRAIFRCDGADDNLRPLVNPASAGTLLCVGVIDAVSDVMMGSRPASDGFCYLATASDGLLAAGIGTQNTATIKGGSDIRGLRGLNAVRWSGTTVRLSRNATVVYEAAQSGAVNTTVPIWCGALNNNGAVASAADLDCEAWVYIDRELTDAEIAGICATYEL